MPRHCILTEREFQLMMASVRCGKLPALEELDLTPGMQIGRDVRDSLVDKQLLMKNEDGRYGVNRKAGYIFSGLSRCEAWVRGDILYPDGSAARLNLYLLDDTFEAVLWRDSDTLECTWMSTYPLAMGSILHCLNHPGEGKLNVQGLQADALLRRALARAEAEVPGGVKAVFAFSEELAPELRNAYIYIAAQDGRFYRAYPEKDELALVCQPIQELVKDLSKHIFAVHQGRIAEVANEQD